MKKSILSLAAGLLIAASAFAQTTIFYWQSDLDTKLQIPVDSTLVATGGSILIEKHKSESTKTSMGSNPEQLVFIDGVDADMVTSEEIYAIKFGTSEVFFNITLDTPLQAGDVIYLSGYGAAYLSTTREENKKPENGEITTNLVLGEDRNTATVASIEVPAGISSSTLYVTRNSKLTLAAIKIVRPAAGGSTALENVAAEVKATKVIENGQLVIIRDGVRYNALGAQL